MKQYVVLSHEPWQAIPTRTQQLVTRLKRAQVLFFEPAGPKERKQGRQVRPGVFLYTLPPPRGAGAGLPAVSPGLAPAGRPGAPGHESPQLPGRRAVDHLPAQVHLLDHLAYQGLIYDCSRDWSHLPLHWEGDLSAAADVVFAASPTCGTGSPPATPTSPSSPTE